MINEKFLIEAEHNVLRQGKQVFDVKLLIKAIKKSSKIDALLNNVTVVFLDGGLGS